MNICVMSRLFTGKMLVLCALLVLSFQSEVVVAQNTTCAAHLPYSGLCSGHGECINEQCVCSPGWTSKSYFYVASDCATSTVAAQTVNLLTYSCAILTTLICCWRIFTLKLYVRTCGKSPSRGKTRARKHVIRITLSSLFVALTVLALFSLVELGSLAVHQSAASVVVMILNEAATNIYGTFYNACLIDMALGPAVRSVSKPRMYKWFVAGEKSVLTLALSICIIGVLAARESTMKIGFQVAFFTCLIADALFVVIIQQYFLRKISRAIDDHLASASRLSKNPAVDQEPLKQAKAAILKIINNGAFMTLFLVAVAVVSAALPPIGGYTYPLGRFSLCAQICVFLITLGGMKLKDDSSAESAETGTSGTTPPSSASRSHKTGGSSSTV